MGLLESLDQGPGDAAWFASTTWTEAVVIVPAGGATPCWNSRQTDKSIWWFRNTRLGGRKIFREAGRIMESVYIDITSPITALVWLCVGMFMFFIGFLSGYNGKE